MSPVHVYTFMVLILLDGECFEYRWMGNSQLIWCERSDGINVTGALLDYSRVLLYSQKHPTILFSIVYIFFACYAFLSFIKICICTLIFSFTAILCCIIHNSIKMQYALSITLVFYSKNSNSY